ncbi:hypothetical protein QC764_0001270 [Podospora pseudoanserina]|uniref:CMP/dCMP-type deaminase domain-containing protein n=1 Tax=Podospora pseudoanserina TaxID=2609844 RepID=A0ABR0IJT5_9PEZI|nr:hypothetical protein QC764_0001270 [Podospora pseudoanserina]
MKRDQCLQLCLQQVTNSPLSYRHGSIVAKGGKILGQGYNDYRHGFNGDTLKTGTLRKAASPHTTPNRPTLGFMPFEIGGDSTGNRCISMHSEMMTIHSALMATRTAAADNMSNVQCGFMRWSHVQNTVAQEKNKTKPSCKKSKSELTKKKRGKQHIPNDLGKKADNRDPKKDRLSCRPEFCRLEEQSHFPTQECPIPRQNNVCQRTKHPKLIGADVYVVRLAHHGTGTDHIKAEEVDDSRLLDMPPPVHVDAPSSSP